MLTMLQWMGGSRRKVTTSRKSTQKRQKQYFEQRKRQQQEQDHSSNVIESYAYNKVPSTQCHENNRSLDILSLLNLSKHGQDCPSRHPEGRGSSNGKHTTQNYQNTHCPNVIQMEIKNVCPSEHVEIREIGIASNHLEDTVSPQEGCDIRVIGIDKEFSCYIHIEYNKEHLLRNKWICKQRSGTSI